MALAVMLPIITYATLIFLLTKRTRIEDLLDAVVKTHLLLLATVALSTECLSILSLLDYPHLLGVWCLLCLCVLLCAFLRRESGIVAPLAIPCGMSRPAVVALGGLGFILATTLAIALLYPPANWDSMTYHMARVANWINNSSVSFYPTSISRQNYQPPLAEFAILHLRVLSGSDWSANLVQWVSFIVTIGLGALLAAELGLSGKKQLLSSVVMATLPMAILQSTSTQNDLVLSSFVLSFALFMLRLRRDATPANMLFASLSLGLACLTKGTAFVYGAAIGASLAVPMLYAARSNHALLLRRIAGLSLVVAGAIVLNAGHFARTYSLYGTPLATGDQNYSNHDRSAPAMLGNIARNIGLHLGTPSRPLNRHIYRAFRHALGAELNNPHTTWHGPPFSISYSRHEDTAGNLIHMLAIVFALVSAFRWIPSCQLHARCYVGGVLVAALLYCLCFKWQPWASRLHTPLFALGAPVIAMALSHYAKGAGRYIALSVIACMAIYCIPFVLNNQSRSLLHTEGLRKSRAERYFANKPHLYESYSAAMNVVAASGGQRVGLYLGLDDGEYPFWVLGHDSGITFHHVGVTEQSRVLATEADLPSHVIATKNTDAWPAGKEYDLVYADQNVRVLKMRRHNQDVPAQR
jgi:hypothetical protein